MGNSATSVRAILDAWRGQGADRMDCVRFHFIDALERRASAHGGETRRLLDGRLLELIEAYADDLEKNAAAATDDSAAADASARGAVSGLIDQIADHVAARGDAAAGRPAARAAFPELAALDDFRGIWSRIRAESQLRQSLEPAPANAGPLNSGRLVHRSLALMRELSPGYLQQFLSYLDALTWMEQINGAGVLAAAEAPATAGGGKRTRDRSRKRRE